MEYFSPEATTMNTKKNYPFLRNSHSPLITGHKRNCAALCFDIALSTSAGQRPDDSHIVFLIDKYCYIWLRIFLPFLGKLNAMTV